MNVPVQPVLRPDDAERATGQFSDASIRTIRNSLDRAGYIVVAGLVTPETCNYLARSVAEDVARIREREDATRHEVGTAVGHLQLGLRRYGNYVSPEVVANPLLECAVAALLGKGAWLGFYNGNVNCPGSGYQSWHFDRPYSWKTQREASADGVSWPPPTTTLSCSLALTEITLESGATAVLPGTHNETAVTDWPAGERPQSHPDLLEQWGPSVAMQIPKGGICLRDPRMWHRGVPNLSDQVRPMMALTYHSARAKNWRGLLKHDLAGDTLASCEADVALKQLDDGSVGDARLVFQSSAAPAFEEPVGPVERNARFVEKPLVVNHFLDAHTLGGARVQQGGEPDPWLDSD